MSSEFSSNHEIHPILGIPVQGEFSGIENPGYLTKVVRRAKALVPRSIKTPVKELKAKLTGVEELKFPYDKTFCYEGIEATFRISRLVEAYRLNPSYEKEMKTEFLKVMSERLAEGKHTVLVVIGAAEGLYPVLAGKFANEIHAFEPDSVCFESLCTNISLNVLGKNVFPSQCAIDWRDSVTNFYVDSKNNFQAASLLSKPTLAGSYPVQTRSLQSLCANGMKKPDVVVMDVEGAERRVLNGFGLKIRPEHLILEVHQGLLKGFDSTADEVLLLVKSWGYKAKLAVRRETELQIHYQLG